MRNWVWAAVVLGLFLPIWRDPSWEGGANAWQALYYLAVRPQKSHIPASEALGRAQEAYEEPGG